jgi:hypothetical protein
VLKPPTSIILGIPAARPAVDTLFEPWLAKPRVGLRRRLENQRAFVQGKGWSCGGASKFLEVIEEDIRRMKERPD